jgi:hypothetical protein
VVRANATECWVNATSRARGTSEYDLVFTDESWDGGRAAVGRHRVRGHGAGAEIGNEPGMAGRTIVPTIPPNHRPRRTRLHRFHILWRSSSGARVAPRDPALLRHLRGDLWTVEAVWDLTDLERAVLSGRARS